MAKHVVISDGTLCIKQTYVYNIAPQTMIQHRLIACTAHSNTKPMITNIIAHKLKLDIVFRVRCGSADYYFVGPIRKQRIDSQHCKPVSTSCTCLALGTRLGCYGKNKHFVSIISKLPNSTCMCNITWTATMQRCRRVTCYDVPIFRFQSPGDSSQPITSYAVADNYEKGCNKI